MKVYKIESSEIDHFCGQNLVHALQVYFYETSSSLAELSDTDEIKEVPESEWGKIQYNDEELGKMTIKKYMSNNPTPGPICSTAY